jgi:hypothetical protein
MQGGQSLNFIISAAPQLEDNTLRLYPTGYRPGPMLRSVMPRKRSRCSAV